MKKALLILNTTWLLLTPFLGISQCFDSRNKVKNAIEIKHILTEAGIVLDSIANGDTLVTRYDVEFKKYFKMVRHQGKVAMVKQNDELDFYFMGTQQAYSNGTLARVNTYNDCGQALSERTYNTQGVLILETSYQPTFVEDKLCLLTMVSGGTSDTAFTETYLEFVEENRQLKHGWFKTWRGEKLVEEIQYEMGKKIAHNRYSN